MVQALGLVELWKGLQHQALIIPNRHGPPFVTQPFARSQIELGCRFLLPASEGRIRLGETLEVRVRFFQLGDRARGQGMIQEVFGILVRLERCLERLGLDR